MGYGAASAERPVDRGAPTPRKSPLVLASIAIALATAVWITHFDPFTSVSDAAAPQDTSSFFEERFSPAAAPISVHLSPRIFIQTRPADIEAKLQQAKPLLALKLRESSAQTQLLEKTAPAPIAAPSPLPRPRPTEAFALQNSEPSPADGDRTLLQKLSDLFPARITLASLTPNLGYQSESPDLASSGFDGFTAVYDISARAVYLPNGSKLEAHSGFGNLKDDPTHVNERNVGATPPAVYDLRPREQLFHGVQALRLIPVEGNATLGRAGLLAHSYMLGSAGDSNGCVSIKDYDKFLAAFQKGEIKRLVVVTSLTDASRRPMLKS
jgi:type VI secretion system (T6SS) effector TldE1-like protein